MKAQNSQKPFRIIKLTPYLISVWGDNGYLSVRTLVRNLVNKNFSVSFLKNNKEIFKEVKMSDEEIIDNMLFIYSLKIEAIKEDFLNIRTFLSENLTRFSDEGFQRKYSRAFFKKFGHIDDIWLEV